jgi:hypothetical protein
MTAAVTITITNSTYHNNNVTTKLYGNNVKITSAIKFSFSFPTQTDGTFRLKMIPRAPYLIYGYPVVGAPCITAAGVRNLKYLETAHLKHITNTAT